MRKQRIIIVGAGFLVVFIVKSLKNKKVDVLLIDQNNFYNFQPFIYRVATGGGLELIG